MKIWIRTQDRKRLLEANEVEIIEILKKHIMLVGDNKIGTYNSEKRAMEILEEIEETVAKGIKLYKMPSE